MIKGNSHPKILSLRIYTDSAKQCVRSLPGTLQGSFPRKPLGRVLCILEDGYTGVLRGLRGFKHACVESSSGPVPPSGLPLPAAGYQHGAVLLPTPVRRTALPLLLGGDGTG